MDTKIKKFKTNTEFSDPSRLEEINKHFDFDYLKAWLLQYS